jgi:hypothetical protein
MADPKRALVVAADPCAICFDRLPKLRKESSNIATLDCGHLFHASCLIRWLARNNNCPVCRMRVLIEAPPEIHHIVEQVPGPVPYTESLACVVWWTLVVLFVVFLLFLAGCSCWVFYDEFLSKGWWHAAKTLSSIFVCGVLFWGSLFLLYCEYENYKRRNSRLHNQ